MLTSQIQQQLLFANYLYSANYYQQSRSQHFNHPQFQDFQQHPSQPQKFQAQPSLSQSQISFPQSQPSTSTMMPTKGSKKFNHHIENRKKGNGKKYSGLEERRG